jgi:hypothetical protein
MVDEHRHDIDLDALIDRARPEGAESASDRFVRQGGTGAPASAADRDPELTADRAAFYAAHPYAAFRKQLDDRHQSRHPWRARWSELWGRGRGLAGALGVLAAAVLAVVVWRGELLPGAPALPDGVRAKGMAPPVSGRASSVLSEEVAIELFVREPAGAAQIADGHALRDGDQVRFSYHSGDLTYVYVFSVDDSGVVDPFYPEDGRESIAIVPGKGVPLPGSVVLDDYVGYERFFAVFSAEPISGERIREAAAAAAREVRSLGGDVRQLDRVPLDAPVAQASIWVVKVAD